MKLRRPLLVVDCETTGVDETRYEIIELGAILLDENLNELDGFVSYVRPETESRDPAAMKVNGIHEHVIASAPKLTDVFTALETMVYRSLDKWGTPTLAGWGVGFDKKFLLSGYEKLSRKWPFGYWEFDIKSIAIWELGFLGEELENYKRGNGVDTVLHALGMEFEGKQHSALDDVKNTVRILRQLRKTHLFHPVQKAVHHAR